VIVRNQKKGVLANHFMIAGVPRSGSSSLYTYLLQHPQICSSSTKETQHFLPANDGKPVASLDAYLAYFTHCDGEAYTMEASVSYFYGGEQTAQAIYEQLGKVRLLFVFRDPTERLFSYFTHDKMFGARSKEANFEDFLRDPAEQAQHASGFYADYLRGWQQVHAGSIKIVYFDDLKREPAALVCDICNWLGLDSTIYEGFEFSQENRGMQYKNRRLHMGARAINDRFEKFLRNRLKFKRAVRRLYFIMNEDQASVPVLAPDTRAYLTQFYEPHNDQLRSFLHEHGYPIGGWLLN